MGLSCMVLLSATGLFFRGSLSSDMHLCLLQVCTGLFSISRWSDTILLVSCGSLLSDMHPF